MHYEKTNRFQRNNITRALTPAATAHIVRPPFSKELINMNVPAIFVGNSCMDR